MFCSVKSVPIERKNLDWDRFFEYMIPSTKITESQSDEIIRFWSQGKAILDICSMKVEHQEIYFGLKTIGFLGNEHMRPRTKSQKLDILYYVREITEIILSPKEDWEPRIIKLFEEATSCSVFVWPGTRVDFLQSLNQFLLLEVIPWKVLQATHVELLKMNAEVFMDDERELLDKTLALTEKRYKKFIGSLMPGRCVED